MTIGQRFRGPADSANGGYAAGLLAAHVDGPTEVTLRLQPPLERPLAVERRGEAVVLLDGDALVAEAVPTEVELDPPPPVSWEQAVEASSRYLPFGADTFRGCFSCGQLRDEGEGLRILPGRVRPGD